MDTLTNCFLLSLFLLGLTTVSALRSLPLLATTNAIMMVCVPMLGASTFTALGVSAGTGNIFLAAAMYGLSLKYYRFGIEEAFRAVNYILFALAVVFGSIFLLDDGLMLSPMFETPIRFVGASFFSFWLVQCLFIALLDRYSMRNMTWRVPLITIAVHALGSAVALPCAFSDGIPPNQVLRFAVAGWLTKSAVALLSVPFYLEFRQRSRPGMTAGA